MYTALLIMLLMFMCVMTIMSSIRKKQSKDDVRTEKKQVKRYYRTIAWMWGPAIGVIAISLASGISLSDLGIRAINFNYNIWFNVIILVSSGLILTFSLRTFIFSLASKTFREEISLEIAGDEVASSILPRTKKEKHLYLFLSFSSGICEELIYRGFMAFLLQAIFPEIPVPLLVLIPSVLFGIGHLYQGWRGIIQTGLVGAIFMCLFLVTNSLLPVMFMHFIINASDTFFLSEENTSEKNDIPEVMPSIHN